jgi:hypothetical protein
MADLEKLRDEAAARAALSTVKNAARRALDDLTMSDEEKAAREAERARASRVGRWKLIAGGVVAVLALLALLSLLAKLWAWLVGLALVAALAYAGYFYLRPKLFGRKVRVELGSKAPPVDERPAQPEAIDPALAAEALRKQEAEAEAARARAKVLREQAIDDELAALKSKVKNG